VFRTTDEGQSWEPISPDLTRNDPTKLGVSGGPITNDTSGAEHYCTVYSLRESAHEQGVLWAGSDDGLVHVSRDNGATWDDVTPPDLPEWSYIRTVEPSPHDAATVYLAATRYKLDDNTPYLYKTTDYGTTWQSIVGSGDQAMPDDEFVRVIRTDPVREGLLYVGTETGIFVSMDDGGSWERWESNLPVSPIYDLTVKGTDLVVATHGRSFWVLDDLTPLYQLDEPITEGATRLFKPRQAWRVLPSIFAGVLTGTDGKDYMIGLGKAANYIAARTETGHIGYSVLDAGQSAPLGVAVSYHLGEAIASASGLSGDGSAVSLAFLDSSGELVRQFSPQPAGYDKLEDDEKAFAPGPWITTKAGVNRFLWDLRYEPATRVLGNKLAWEANQGPLVVPGTYQARLTLTDADGTQTEHTESFDVVNDPRAGVSLEDLQSQLDLLLAIRGKISEAHEGVTGIRAARDQVAHWQEKLAAEGEVHGEVIAAAEALTAKLNAIEDELIVPGRHKDTFGLNQRSRLNEKLSSLISVVASADSRPTKQAAELVGVYSGEIDEQLSRWQAVMAADVEEFNALVAATNVPPVQ
jgi:hypothetical protein